MSDIKNAIQQLESPKKEIGNFLMSFYETMKELEKDPLRSGKQATKIMMTIRDIEKLINKP